MVEVSHVTKEYSNGHGIHDISFTLKENRIYGLLGPNGAGKSTLLNLITGYYMPDNCSATKSTVPNGSV